MNKEHSLTNVRKKSTIAIPSFFYEIGRCPACMRQAFKAACATVVVSIITLCAAPLLGVGYTAATVTSALALIALSLWTFHLLVSAMRFARRRAMFNPEHEDFMANRRRFLANFVKGFVGVALATSIPTLANAQVTCTDGSQCNPGTHCCYYGNDVWCCDNSTSCGQDNCIPNN